MEKSVSAVELESAKEEPGIFSIAQECHFILSNNCGIISSSVFLVFDIPPIPIPAALDSNWEENAVFYPSGRFQSEAKRP